jgi:hypothetical protein
MARPTASRKILSDAPMFFCIFYSFAEIISLTGISLFQPQSDKIPFHFNKLACRNL